MRNRGKFTHGRVSRGGGVPGGLSPEIFILQGILQGGARIQEDRAIEAAQRLVAERKARLRAMIEAQDEGAEV